MAVITAGVMIGSALVSSMGTVVTEAFIDTTTDFVIDKTTETFQKVLPNFSNNQFIKQFTNQVRMGVAVQTNARIMSASIKSQNRIEEKLETRRDEMRQKYEAKKTEINNKSFGKGAKGKRIKSLNDQYRDERKSLSSDAERIIAMRQSSATESGTFSNGTGSLKTGNDGTINNMKSPTNNADLVNSIDDLLNGMGYYKDET